MPRSEESGLSIEREREVRGTYIGGFPEHERAIRGGGGSRSPEGVARKSPISAQVRRKSYRGRAYRGTRDYRRGRGIDCLIVLC